MTLFLAIILRYICDLQCTGAGKAGERTDDAPGLQWALLGGGLVLARKWFTAVILCVWKQGRSTPVEFSGFGVDLPAVQRFSW